MAEWASIDFTYLSKIENDRLDHTPSIKTIHDPASALGADELELLELANKPPVLEVIVHDREAPLRSVLCSCSMPNRKSPVIWS